MKTPETDALAARRRALEDSFFAERDRQLLSRLRGELGQLEERQKLANVSGIRDEKVLKDLLDSGIRAETLAAVRLVPLVAVAWSDGAVSATEAQAVLRAAAEDGVNPSSACHDLLSKWLETSPGEATLTGWKEYMRELAKVLPPDSVSKLREELRKRLQGVAKAAGGILGIQSISQQEQQTIDNLIGSF